MRASSVRFIAEQGGRLDESLKEELFAYRYKVFVENLGWNLNATEGFEIDQFDNEKTFYIVATSRNKEVVGCARLLPTTSPYLLEQIFPQLLDGKSPPKSEHVWELSRFTTVDLLKGKGSSRKPSFGGQMTYGLGRHLLLKAMACARQNGAKTIISVSPIGVERLLKRMGVSSVRAGPPMIVDGYPLFACVIEL